MIQSFSSDSTFGRNCAASVASRPAIAASRALASGGAAAPARVKSETIAVEHARPFGRQPEVACVRLERVDALEQSLVQISLAARGRAPEFRRDLALDCLQFITRVGAGQYRKHARNFVEAAAAALERFNRVGEIGGTRTRPRRCRSLPALHRGLCRTQAEMAEARNGRTARLERSGLKFEKRVRVDRGGGQNGAVAHASQLGGSALIRNPSGALSRARVESPAATSLFPRKRESRVWLKRFLGCPLPQA